jgi:hypothetical protein
MRRYLIFLTSILLLTAVMGAAEKETVIIDEPVDGDLFLSNDTVIVDAEVDGDIFIAAGQLEINAPVTGDVFAAGGQVSIDAPVEGSVILVGGTIKLNDDVGGKIIAFGGMVEISGNAEKVVAAGGRVEVGSGAVIDGPAYLAGGQVDHAGEVKGTLHVSSTTFNNRGKAAEVKRDRMEGISSEDIAGFVGAAAFVGIVLGVLLQFGFLILGVVMLRWFPRQFLVVEEEARESPVRNTVLGFVFIIVAGVLAVILAVTVVGLPMSIVFSLLVLVALLISSLFVALAFGRKLAGALRVETSPTWMLVMGFVVLSLLLWVPILGMIVGVITVSLGFGSMYYALRGSWDSLTSRPAL